MAHCSVYMPNTKIQHLDRQVSNYLITHLRNSYLHFLHIYPYETSYFYPQMKTEKLEYDLKGTIYFKQDTKVKPVHHRKNQQVFTAWTHEGWIKLIWVKIHTVIQFTAWFIRDKSRFLPAFGTYYFHSGWTWGPESQGLLAWPQIPTALLPTRLLHKC